MALNYKKLVVLGVMTAAGVLGAALPAMANKPGGGVTTLAGAAAMGSKDGKGEEAGFFYPQGLEVREGSLYVTDTGSGSIRIYHGNRVMTLVEGIKERDPYGQAISVSIDGAVSEAALGTPWDIVRLRDGRTIFTDRESHSLRVIEGGWVYTLCGGKEGYAEGTGRTAAFSSPSGMALDEARDCMYVADMGNHCIRRIDSQGRTSLVAGVPGQAGYADGPAGEALFQEPLAVAVGEDGSLYVSDTGNSRIRKISGGTVTTVAGSGGEFSSPGGITAVGNTAVFTDMDMHRVLACGPDGVLYTVAGTGEPGHGDGLPGEATFNMPWDVAWEDGYLYVTDYGNSALRAIEWSPEGKE